MKPRWLRLNFGLWLASAALLLGALAASAPGFRFDTDLLSMLPQDSRDLKLEAVTSKASGRYARQLIFIVAEPDFAHARQAGAALADALRSSPAIGSVRYEADASALAPDAAFQAACFGLLTPQDRARLDHGEAVALGAEALSALYSPAAFARLTTVVDDPFGFSDRFLRAGLAAPGRAAPEGGVLTVREADRVQVLVFAETAQSPFDASAQQALAQVIDQARAAAEAQGAVIAGSGVALHALAAAAQAKREVSMLGGGSALLCAALLFAVFGALRPSLLALLSMGFGMAAGLLVSHTVFGRLHLMTVVFGTSLVGVSLDYAIHFLADQLRDPKGWQPREALDHIGTAVWMGLATTLLGYVAFAAAPMPVLQQMAVFSAAGLCASAWTVWMAFPVLARPAPMRRHALWLGLAAALRPRRLPAWCWLLLGAVAVLGCTRIRFADDVRLLQHSPPALLAEEQAVRSALGAGFDSRFFLVQADDAETLLQREEALATRLAALIDAKVLEGARQLSQGLPSQRQQTEDLARIAPLYAEGGAATSLLQGLGFSPAQIAAQRAALVASVPLDIRAIESPRLAGLVPLWLGRIDDGEFASVTSLLGVHDPARLAVAVTGLEGVTLHDPVAEASNALQQQRRAALARLGWVYAAMALLLMWRYGPRGGLQTLAAPALASALTLAVLGSFGLAVNLFTVLTLLLVLGFGVDYAIFLREGARHAADAPPSSRMAVWLAAATALLSFGGLSFSATPFLRDIGLTLSLGITLALLLALALAPQAANETA